MADPSGEPQESGPFAYEGLDRVLHEKARLGILSSLVANPQGLLFTELKSLCSLTDGNLSRHMQVLQDAGLIEVWKGSQGKRPQTLARLTEPGRAKFMEYIGVLEQIVAEAGEALRTDRSTGRAVPGWDWSSA